jgi:DNA-binding Lrp family transcriptional regulator
MIPHWVPQESRVFNVFLRCGPLSIREAADYLGMKPTACWNHVIRLKHSGLLGIVRIEPRCYWGKQMAVYDLPARITAIGRVSVAHRG